MSPVPQVHVDAVGIRPFQVVINPTDRPVPNQPELLRVVDPDTATEQGCEPVQLLEGKEYRYVITGLDDFRPITTDVGDIVIPDHPDDGRSGHLRPGQRVGLLPINLISGPTVIGQISLEVRSRKLDYLTDFRWMLRDIATESIGMLLHDFAPTHMRFESDPQRSPESAYQTFRLIRALIEDPVVQAALQIVINRPHSQWTGLTETRPSARGLSNAASSRALFAPGPRVPWPGAGDLPLKTLPACLAHQQSIEELDTPPNRFIKHVLEHWAALTSGLKSEVSPMAPGPVRARALREIDSVLSQMALLLEAPLFREVSRLHDMPGVNQVLLKRPGYREVLLAYAMVQSGIGLRFTALPGLTAGQRDVPRLYEYWVFMWVAEAVKAVCDELEDQDIRDGRIAGGKANCVSGRAQRLGRAMKLRLCYNRSFDRATRESWSSQMRPDVSLQISLASPFPEAESMWLHFDAKYRLAKLANVFSDDDDAPDQAVRDDVLKMHAYKDAIRSSGGAFVVFPASQSDGAEIALEDSQQKELLPGVGAFQLTPAEQGSPKGFEAIKDHIDHALTHYASTVSRDRRARFWTSQTYSDSRDTQPTGIGQLFARPPADVPVLLGYVRSSEQLSWIRRTSLYNLRAGDRPGAVTVDGVELACDYVLLYGESIGTEVRPITGGPVACDRSRMAGLGYPNPSEAYFCVPIGAPIDLGAIDRAGVEAIAIELARIQRKRQFAPVVATLLDVIGLRLQS
jgi:hypothetical protein